MHCGGVVLCLSAPLIHFSFTLRNSMQAAYCLLRIHFAPSRAGGRSRSRAGVGVAQLSLPSNVSGVDCALHVLDMLRSSSNILFSSVSCILRAKDRTARPLPPFRGHANRSFIVCLHACSPDRGFLPAVACMLA